MFGYKSFRLHQAAIIETLLSGSDALALMPTGGGKSLCYQIPALVRAGTGIVVSPLIALMQDQVDALKEAGVRAAFLNSTLDRREQDGVEARLAAAISISSTSRPSGSCRSARCRSLSRCHSGAVRHRRGALRLAVGARLPPRVPPAQGAGRALSLRCRASR